MGLSIIILAAGRGSRMKSSLPKVLHKVAGKELINHVRDTALLLSPEEIIITISPNSKDIEEATKHNLVKYAYQEQQLGTGDSVKSAIKRVSNISNYILVLYGDTALMKPESLKNLYDKAIEAKSPITILGFKAKDPSGYGRLVTNNNIVEKIVESRDANSQELNIRLCNSGIILFEGKILETLIPLLKNNNSQNEYYLTDIIKLAKEHNIDSIYMETNEEEVHGVNSRLQLSQAEEIYQNRLRNKFMEEGVTLIDPKSVTFNYDTKIASDVIIHPNIVFGRNVEVESGVEIKSFSHIEGAHIKNNAIIGPFARIRPNTVIEENAHIGNFVEIKNSNIGKATKVNHLSYIGDTNIGQKTNIGAGVITCNYDGFKKYNTIIEDNVFIGSNSALIAPIIIESNSIIAAGSVINKKIEKDSIAISRPDLKILKGKAVSFRNKKQV